jgi:tryptophan synthase alpha chain
VSPDGGERIAAAFAHAAEEGRPALMPYLMGGYPDDETSRSVIAAYADSGADLIELGVPFSDPLADGPVIHAAGTKALASGATFDSVLELGATVSAQVPVVAMLYANMIFTRGIEQVADALAEAGLAGVIVPDLPPEEAGDIRDAMQQRGMVVIPLVAPTTPPARRAEICAGAGGFIYLVSDTRTTGERDELPPALQQLVADTKADSPVPVAVGFGIGTPQQVATVGAFADGVIVGTRLVRAVGESPDAEQAGSAVAEFLGAAREAASSSDRLPSR